MEKLTALHALQFKYEPLQPSCFYHVYNRANGNEKLFTCKENYQFFLKQYSLFIAPVADTFCYCLMPNHFHLLIRIKPEADLFAFFEGMERIRALSKLKDSPVNGQVIYVSKRGPDGFTPDQIEKLISRQFANFFSSYTQAFNKTYMRMGNLFMKNFKRKKVTSILYLRTLTHYIHLNPVESSLCIQASDWPFSSYKTIIAGEDNLIKATEVIEWFEDLGNFMNTHRNIPELLEF